MDKKYCELCDSETDELFEVNDRGMFPNGDKKLCKFCYKTGAGNMQAYVTVYSSQMQQMGRLMAQMGNLLLKELKTA